MTPVIFTTHRLHAKAMAVLGDLGIVVVASAPDPTTLAREGKAADPEVIIVRAPLPDCLFDPSARLLAAIRHGAGLDMIPLASATEAGVLVANVPGVNARSVAEHVMMSALVLLRRLRQVDRDLRTKGWGAARGWSDHGQELAGQTMGIIGMGAVGHAIAAIAGPGFGVTVVGHSRSGSGFPAGVAALGLAELLATSDIVVLACPLTDQTRGLIDAAALVQMKPGSLLINVARGAVVVEAALVAALRSGALGGAALDVFDQQPLPPDHPLLALDTVLITPHMAGVTDQSMERMGLAVAGLIRQVLGGSLPATVVNPEIEERWRQRIPMR